MKPRARPPLAGLRVLVVEDEMLVGDYLVMLLEDLGCDVVGPVPTIATALAAVRAERLDGVLLDANLEGVGSGPLAEELRTRALPFVVVTGYGSLPLVGDALNDAPRVSKPLDSAALGRVMTATFLR